MYPDIFVIAQIHTHELLRAAQAERLAAQLPQTRRAAWRSAAAAYVRGFADWLEPRIEPSPRPEPLRAA